MAYSPSSNMDEIEVKVKEEFVIKKEEVKEERADEYYGFKVEAAGVKDEELEREPGPSGGERSNRKKWYE